MEAAQQRMNKFTGIPLGWASSAVHKVNMPVATSALLRHPIGDRDGIGAESSGLVRKPRPKLVAACKSKGAHIGADSLHAIQLQDFLYAGKFP